mmetsp:Transcript_24363/g.50419  ORF Transcript_24363/g.50419 Transcript_24363/m.50419 type:complete len:734 (-) Transcript_24363:315-2516(-)
MDQESRTNASMEDQTAAAQSVENSLEPAQGDIDEAMPTSPTNAETWTSSSENGHANSVNNDTTSGRKSWKNSVTFSITSAPKGKPSIGTSYTDNEVSIDGSKSIGIKTRRIFNWTGSISKETKDGIRPGRAVIERCEARVGCPIKARIKKRLMGTRCNKGKRTLLMPMRVDIPAGSITAIVGTADSGKSSLLKFLAGCNDKNVHCEGVVNLPGTSSFIPEETYLHRFYTPRTYIEHYRKLISSSGEGYFGSRKMDKDDIDKFLDSLQISVDRRDTIVGDPFSHGLSPGERRRLEIGLSVLGAPDTLYCENPIEGFDSETSLHIMEFLKGYSNHPSRRVIVTLNKPSQFVWTLIDNVILLSHDHRLVYSGPRFDLEKFFSYNKMPTPKRFFSLEHYLSVVNTFRHGNQADLWERNFKEWRENANRDDESEITEEIDGFYSSAIPEVRIPKIHSVDSKDFRTSKIWLWIHVFFQLLKRYLRNMIYNPGMVQIRLGMYTILALFLGMLFYDMDTDSDVMAAASCAALLFYSTSFFIFMVGSILPFLAHDRFIRDKEVLNGIYHPVTHHLAVTVSMIPAVLLLAFVITLIMVGLVKFHNPVTYFLIMLLALWCGEALAMLVSLNVKNYIIGIIVVSGVCGCFMPLMGFMVVPSKFPKWLRWANVVPFHTYAWQSLMFNEFSGDESGHNVLELYEIEDVDVGRGMVVLLGYSLVIHFFSIVTLILKNPRRMSRKLKAS